MTKPKLTYFDIAASRGEECRLALTVAGVEFEDVRIKAADWAALKPTTPFGGLPLFEVPGHRVFAQSNAILVLIGRRYGLHPKDDFEAARHEALMQHVEDLRAAIAPSQRMKDEAQRKEARLALADTYLPAWARGVEKQLGEGPFVAGAQIHVADIKLYMAVRWIARGTLDHIPASLFAAFPKLTRLHDAVAAHPRVKAWNDRQ
jgi:glutathione S-transferase